MHVKITKLQRNVIQFALEVFMVIRTLITAAVAQGQALGSRALGAVSLQVPNRAGLGRKEPLLCKELKRLHREDSLCIN